MQKKTKLKGMTLNLRRRGREKTTINVKLEMHVGHALPCPIVLRPFNYCLGRQWLVVKQPYTCCQNNIKVYILMNNSLSPAIITINKNYNYLKLTSLDRSHIHQGEVYCSSCASKIYAQAGASKLGNTMNDIDKGLMYKGELTSSRTGSNFGMFSSSVSSNGSPLRSMVWLRRFPSFAVKWYSSLYNGSSDARLPTHETDLLRPRTKGFSPDMFSSTVNLMSMLF